MYFRIDRCFSNSRKIDFASFDCIKRPISALKKVFTFGSMQRISVCSCLSADIEFVDGRRLFDQSLLEIGFGTNNAVSHLIL